MVTVDTFSVLTKAAGELTQLVRASGTVEALREVKDAGEIALLRLACEAADAALHDLVERGGLRPGRTEKDVARELEALMLDHGADGVSLKPSSPPGPTLRSPIIGRPMRCCLPATSSRSTSAHWCAATTPT